jgi:hypothetical protein
MAKKAGRDSVQQSRPTGQAGAIYRNLGKGERGAKSGGQRLTGSVKGREASGKGAHQGVRAGAGSGYGRLHNSRVAGKVPAKTES